jgi:hypothetical protein
MCLSFVSPHCVWLSQRVLTTWRFTMYRSVRKTFDFASMRDLSIAESGGMRQARVASLYYSVNHTAKLPGSSCDSIVELPGLSITRCVPFVFPDTTPTGVPAGALPFRAVDAVRGGAGGAWRACGM